MSLANISACSHVLYVSVVLRVWPPIKTEQRGCPCVHVPYVRHLPAMARLAFRGVAVGKTDTSEEIGCRGPGGEEEAEDIGSGLDVSTLGSVNDPHETKE